MSRRKCCCCAACLNKVNPPELTVTVAGFTDDGLCGTGPCSHANGSWVLSAGDCVQSTNGDSSTRSSITYTGSFPTTSFCPNYPTCVACYLSIVLTIVWNDGASGKRTVSVGIDNTDGGIDQNVQIYYQLQQSGQSQAFDCTSFAALNIPYDYGGALCNQPGATVKVTS